MAVLTVAKSFITQNADFGERKAHTCEIACLQQLTDQSTINRQNKPNLVSSLNYKPIDRRTRESILESLQGSDPHDIHEALECAAYWDEDWRWAQTQLLRFSQHDSDEVLWSVALGFTFLAVFHGEID